MAHLVARVLALAPLGAAPSPTVSPAASPGRGTGFVILALLLVGAFLLSTWRLRRDR